MATTITPPVATPAPTTPTAPDPSTGSMSDLLQSSFKAAEPPTPPAEPPATEQPPAVPPTPPATPEPAPTTGEPTPAQPVEGAPVDLDFSDPASTDPDSVDADGRRHFYTKTKSERLQAAGKFVQSLQNLIPVVTPEIVGERIARANAADAMMTSYEEAARNPKAADEIIHAVFLNDGNPSPVDRQAFGTLILQGLAKLPEVNPAVFNHINAVHNKQTMNVLRERARYLVANTPPILGADGNQRMSDQASQAVALAMRFEEAMTNGTFTPSEQWLTQQPAQPQDLERQRFEQERTRFYQDRQTEQQQRQQQWQSHVFASQDSAQREEAARALGDDTTSPYWQTKLNEVMTAIASAEQAHPEWQTEWENLNRQAMLNPTAKNLEAVVKYRRNIAAQVARRTAPAVTTKYSTVELKNNQAQHARAASGASEPSLNGGSPTPAPNGALQKAIENPDLRGSLRDLFTSTR